jgi:hypothetical protein
MRIKRKKKKKKINDLAVSMRDNAVEKAENALRLAANMSEPNLLKE